MRWNQARTLQTTRHLLCTYISHTGDTQVGLFSVWGCTAVCTHYTDNNSLTQLGPLCFHPEFCEDMCSQWYRHRHSDIQSKIQIPYIVCQFICCTCTCTGWNTCKFNRRTKQVISTYVVHVPQYIPPIPEYAEYSLKGVLV